MLICQQCSVSHLGSQRGSSSTRDLKISGFMVVVAKTVTSHCLIHERLSGNKSQSTEDTSPREHPEALCQEVVIQVPWESPGLIFSQSTSGQWNCLTRTRVVGLVVS